MDCDNNGRQRARIGGHAIDFTSNSPNMTTVTCQRNRIVSRVGIVPIRRYILLRSVFFRRRRQEDARRLKKTRPASGVAVRRRTKETAEDDVEAVAVPPRRRAIDFLSSSRVYDISPRFDTTRNLSACHACLSRTAARSPPAPIHPSGRPSVRSFVRPSAPARICLYPRRIQRMLPGYCGKAEATYSAEFLPRG